MAITNGYLTLAEFRAALDIVDAAYTADDGDMERAIEAASREIDVYCGRYFYLESSGTRYYTPNRADYLAIDDLAAITALREDVDGDGTYERLWAATDYHLAPYNAAATNRPYTAIERNPTGVYEFSSAPKSIKLTGNFGWAAVPIEIEQACLIEANRLLWRRTSPAGVAGFSDLGVARIFSRLDPDAQKLIDPYRKLVPVF